MPGIFGTKTCLLIDYRKLKKSGEQYIAIEDLAYVSEIISGIVVATTLIILVFQLRQSNRRAQSEAVREAANDFIKAIVQATSTESNAENLRLGVHNFDNLSADRKARFHSTMLDLTVGFDQIYHLSVTQQLDKEHFLAAQRTYIGLMMTPDGQQRWNSFKQTPPNFLVEYIDQVVADSELNIKAAHECYPWLAIGAGEEDIDLP